jgi:DNA-binding Xre family transcriptional regulator
MNVGKSIKVALAKKGLKQKDLADLMGIKPPSVSALAGQKSCSGETLEKLAAALDLPVSEFIALGE